MPISADRFDAMADDEHGPTPGTNAHTILSFLEANPDKAFTQTEIVAATDVVSGSVGPTLVRLRDAGRVDHRGRYWRVSDHVQSLDNALAHADSVASSREDAPMDSDDWQPYAADPRVDRE